GIPYPSLPKKEKPRRVELYFSSWRIRPVQSPKKDGQQPMACEVTLFHYEDMGIPKDVAKVGVRHGMWGAVKKLQSGFRAYQLMRKSENILSRSAIMARVTTKTCIASSDGSLDQGPFSTEQASTEDDNSRSVQHGFDWKWVVVGGAVAAVCVLNTGIVGKALLLGAARKQAKK
ncbi:hypothetical protein CFC21_023163, partial [Triticum aestivum]